MNFQNLKFGNVAKNIFFLALKILIIFGNNFLEQFAMVKSD
jgi:hypothetical protein